jgi:hypothetical protein
LRRAAGGRPCSSLRESKTRPETPIVSFIAESNHRINLHRSPSGNVACGHGDEHRSSTTRRIRETEAEAVAFVVCSAIGLETGGAAADYIGLYGGAAKLLSDSLEYVQRTATQILNSIGANETSAPPV